MMTSYTSQRSPLLSIRYSMGMSEPALVTSLLSTKAWSPSIRSFMYWIFSPPYSSIFEMYERSRRSPNSLTNSSRSACVRAAQCRPSERLAVSPKSKMSSAILRTATRLSFGLSFSAGSSISLSTRSTCALSCSVRAPAPAGGAASTSARVTTSAVMERHLLVRILPLISLPHLAEHIIRQQLLAVHRRLHLAALSPVRDDLVLAPRP